MLDGAGFRSTRVMMRWLIEQCMAKAQLGGATVAQSDAWNVLLLNNTPRVRIALASRRRYPDTLRHWRVPMRHDKASDFVLCALLDRGNDEIEQFMLLATETFEQGSLFVCERTIACYHQQCFATLDKVCGLTPGR
ncbi:hypothetical protein [Pseudoduganella lutea]|uniref:Uncharacterized protein n=1 Tax=Pseudoduganella lutea TaxID=321985 RepID=A0A4P6L4I4_9BURK|nr:hypothetical protein [Pseudoduganella lutea]QBE66387.1 hypothetical protein EWM63_28280 [Pseudoduganella lutea]